MNNSQLIVYTFKQALYCCCFVQDSIMACSSNKALVLWDFAEGKMIGEYSFAQQISPISITAVASSNFQSTLLLQLKQTKAIIFKYDKKSKRITKTNQYQLDMIGFNKLSLAAYKYDSSGIVQKEIGGQFFTIRYSNTIQNREILTGKIVQTIEVDQTKFQEVSFLLTYIIDNSTYFLVVQEGATFKQFQVGKQLQLVEPKSIMKIPSKQQLKIVLAVQPISEHRAYVCLRNDYVYLINLKEFQVEHHLNISNYRMVKSIPQAKEEKMYALSSKNQVSLLKNSIIKSRQKIDKSFILDIDTFQFGIIGVTEQGKIIFFPLI